MQEFIYKIIPNVIDEYTRFFQSILDTLLMLFGAGTLAFVLGLSLGVGLIITQRGGICENKIVFFIIDKTVNLFRSIPFIVLLAALIPLTRLIAGTAIGVQGAIVPLVFGATPFFARQVESALASVPAGLIEAAQSMGISPTGIIFRVYLRESIASIARATTITLISLLGLTAMAGAVGAGGLGDFAVQFGYQRNHIDATYVSVFTLLIIVGIIQSLGAYIAKKTTH